MYLVSFLFPFAFSLLCIHLLAQKNPKEKKNTQLLIEHVFASPHIIDLRGAVLENSGINQVTALKNNSGELLSFIHYFHSFHSPSPIHPRPFPILRHPSSFKRTRNTPMEVIEQELYGGAITMNLPRKFGNIRYKINRIWNLHLDNPILFVNTHSPLVYEDIYTFANKNVEKFPSSSLQLVYFSHVREVPDHQEVFVNVDEDQSVIVEILELAAEASDDGCAA